MAQSLTSSALNNVQERLYDLFGPDTPYRSQQFTYPADTASALFKENTVRTSPVLVDGQCIGVDAKFLNWGSSGAAYTGAPSGDSLSCDLDGGDDAAAGTKTYVDNLLVRANYNVEDNLCGNLFNDAPGNPDGRAKAATMIAEGLALAMRNIREGLNTTAVTFLNATRSPVNIDTNLPSYITFDNANDYFEAADTYYQDPRFLTDINFTAQNNNINSFFLITGRNNFANAFTDSRYLRLNDNQRNYVQFDDFSMYVDPRAIDSALSSSNTFVVGRGSYLAWNRTWSTPLPFQIDEDKWEFSVRDPFLMIMENGIMRPVTYEVVYQKTCVGRDSNTRHYFKHEFEVKFLGGIDEAPPAPNTHTNIMRWTAIASV